MAARHSGEPEPASSPSLDPLEAPRSPRGLRHAACSRPAGMMTKRRVVRADLRALAARPDGRRDLDDRPGPAGHHAERADAAHRDPAARRQRRAARRGRAAGLRAPAQRAARGRRPHRSAPERARRELPLPGALARGRPRGRAQRTRAPGRRLGALLPDRCDEQLRRLPRAPAARQRRRSSPPRWRAGSRAPGSRRPRRHSCSSRPGSSTERSPSGSRSSATPR